MRGPRLMVRTSAKGRSSKWMGGGAWAMQGLSFLSVVWFSEKVLKRSVASGRLAGDYTDGGRMRKSHIPPNLVQG
jgi:hypothetical protein